MIDVVLAIIATIFLLAFLGIVLLLFVFGVLFDENPDKALKLCDKLFRRKK